MLSHILMTYNCSEFSMCTCSGSPHNVMHSSSSLAYGIYFTAAAHAFLVVPFALLEAFGLPLFMPPFRVPSMKWKFESWHDRMNLWLANLLVQHSCSYCRYGLLITIGSQAMYGMYMTIIIHNGNPYISQVCVCGCVCVCFTQVARALQDLPFTLLGASGTALPLFIPPFWVPGMKWAFESCHHQMNLWSVDVLVQCHFNSATCMVWSVNYYCVSGHVSCTMVLCSLWELMWCSQDKLFSC